MGRMDVGDESVESLYRRSGPLLSPSPRTIRNRLREFQDQAQLALGMAVEAAS